MNGKVEVRELVAVSDLATADQVLEQVWESPEGGVQIDLLRAVAFGGGYVAGAYLDGRMVGAAMGFLARTDDEAPIHLHSHAVGVLPEAQGLHVGLGLKLHQRAWALDHRIDDIQWTYDPLQARNAAFNLGRLGARPVTYHVDFYGEMVDAFNAGSDSDRLLVSWQLTSDHVMAALAGGVPAEVDSLPVALAIGTRGEPELRETGAGACLWSVPQDINVIRRQDPELARQWREVTRQLFTETLATGATVTFVAGRGYLVSSTAPAETAATASIR